MRRSPGIERKFLASKFGYKTHQLDLTKIILISAIFTCQSSTCVRMIRTHHAARHAGRICVNQSRNSHLLACKQIGDHVPAMQCLILRNEIKWKCIDFKCIRKPTKRWLSL